MPPAALFAAGGKRPARPLALSLVPDRPKKFTEQSPIEDGFAQVFEAEVKPKLIELEFDRQATVRKTQIHRGLAIALAVVAAGLSFLIFGDEDGP